MSLPKDHQTLPKGPLYLPILVNKINELDNYDHDEFDFLIKYFYGNITNNIPETNTIIYLTGDVSKYEHLNNYYVIKDFAINYTDNMNLINVGKVPINICNVGIFFREFFTDDNYFDKITQEHVFQTLVESNKNGEAYRKGIYLTPCYKDEHGVNFNLLRCSTNLKGPTENFKDMDNYIVNEVMKFSKNLFPFDFNLNHVLAQVYHNTMYNNKQKKATIKAHSDKTKDMPQDAVMAFCTFYQNYYDGKFNGLKYIKKQDKYDYFYSKNNDKKDKLSILTQLKFKLKFPEKYPELAKEFSITCYPNSLFLIPLSTNRIYTHEVKPSALPIDKIPVRLGYVIRCSKTRAIYKDKTYIITESGEQELLKPTEEDINNLKKLYLEENITDDVIVYDNIPFSLNDGDYLEPM